MTKKIIKNISIAALAFMVTPTLISCERDLQIYSESAISPDQINEGNIQYFLNGLYRNTTPQRDNYVLNDIRGGNYTWTALSGSNSSYGVLITGNGINDDNSFSSSLWSYCYNNIYDANIVIEAAQKLNKKTIAAEAHFLRAYLYYQLVTTFGGVPMITQNTSENKPRESATAIWDLIESDLDFAISNGRPFVTTGNKTVSIQMAKALKARVALALNKKTMALDLANQVIAESQLKVDNDYARIFRSTNQSTEVLFAFANLPTENNVRLSQLFWPYGTTWAGSYFVQPSDEVLANLYSAEDSRKEINFQTINNSNGTSNTIVSKYWDVQPMIVSRISEIYLIVAEAKGLSTEGINAINEIRLKRNLTAFVMSDFTSENDFLNQILTERQRELYSEGFLFYDLVRTDKALDLPHVSSKDQYLMPIPGSQIKLSNGVLIQNPGY